MSDWQSESIQETESCFRSGGIRGSAIVYNDLYNNRMDLINQFQDLGKIVVGYKINPNFDGVPTTDFLPIYVIRQSSKSMMI